MQKIHVNEVWHLDFYEENIDGMISILEDIKREAEEGGWPTPVFDLCYGDDFCDMDMRSSRLETDEELAKRKRDQDKAVDEMKQYRLKQFLKLKEEFEPDEKQLGDLL